MKKIKASELKVGDIYYYVDHYSVVLSTKPTLRNIMYGIIYVQCKCIMAPSYANVGIGSIHYIRNNIEVLLCEDSNEEN